MNGEAKGSKNIGCFQFRCLISKRHIYIYKFICINNMFNHRKYTLLFKFFKYYN